MGSFQRAQVDTLLRRLAEPPLRILALFGPRQTGKTTIVQQVLDQIEQPSRYLAVDKPDAPDSLRIPATARETIRPQPLLARDTAWLVREWEEARRKARHSERGFVLVFDEIQKIPQWSETVKGLWDANRASMCPLQVVILGSSPLLLQSGLTESLAGRFEHIRVTHWSFQEMAAAFGFDLPTYLYFGGYPGAVSLVRDQARWRDYILKAIVEPNIERDIVAMNRVQKPALLKRLFELGAVWSGQILSYTKMLGHLQERGNTTTLADYLHLLETAGLLAGLPRYVKSPIRRGSSPKLIGLNTAFMTAYSEYTHDTAMADRTFWGRLVESAAGAHLFNTATSDMRLSYWRDEPHEVDFVLQRGSELVAIEVKSGQMKPTSLRGLATFTERFRPQHSLSVGEGGIPLQEFLAMPAARWFEDA